MRRRAIILSGSEGQQLRTELTVLSDLSANVFAALLLILIVLLQIKALATEAEATKRPPSVAVDATTDLGAVARQPLRAVGLVGLLQRRHPQAAGLSVDVAAGHLGLVRDGHASHVPSDQALAALDAALREPGADASVRLYVFANALYRPVVDRLRRAGVAWDELSVPQALRDADDEDRWSSDFLSLVAQSSETATFRTGLSHLLAASRDRLVPDGRVAGRAGSGTDAPPGTAARRATSLLDRLLGWFGLALGIAMLLAGLGVVATTEWLVRLPSARYPEPSASESEHRNSTSVALAPHRDG